MIVIDSHLDLGFNAVGWNRDLTKSVWEIRKSEEGMTEKGRGMGTVALPELRQAEVAVCLGTVAGRVKKTGPISSRVDFRSHEIAHAYAQSMLAYYRVLQKQGRIRMIADRAGLDAHLEAWRGPHAGEQPLGLILAMEGADPIISPEYAEDWYRDGLRVVSLSHYGLSQYSHGTETEGGLFPQGRELLKEMQRLGIILDLTHLADQAFWEALAVFDGPVLASHNCCRALVPGQRQFTDEMVKAIVARGGVIGVAMDDWMLVPGWVRGVSTNEIVSLEQVVDQLAHICELAGNADHVAIGTDLDGGFGYEQSPNDLHTIADLQKIPALMERRGFTRAQAEQVMHGNWLRFFQRAWS